MLLAGDKAWLLGKRQHTEQESFAHARCAISSYLSCSVVHAFAQLALGARKSEAKRS